MITKTLSITAAEFGEKTGWDIKPEGACKGDVCVPLGDGSSDSFDLTSAASRLGMSIVENKDHGLWAIGPESIGGRALTTAQAPDLTLPDLDGNEFKLSSLRGQKVVIVSWAPY